MYTPPSRKYNSFLYSYIASTNVDKRERREKGANVGHRVERDAEQVAAERLKKRMQDAGCQQVLQLTYFGVRGSCDKVRLLLALTGLEYREIIVQGRGTLQPVAVCFPSNDHHAEFAGLKHGYEFGQLPLLGTFSSPPPLPPHGLMEQSRGRRDTDRASERHR